MSLIKKLFFPSKIRCTWKSPSIFDKVSNIPKFQLNKIVSQYPIEIYLNYAPLIVIYIYISLHCIKEQKLEIFG